MQQIQSVKKPHLIGMSIAIFPNVNRDGVRWSMSDAKKHEVTDVLAQEIMRYFEDHPKASDSVQGIAKWWLKHQRYVEAEERVELALDRLVAEGKIQKIRTSDSTSVYVYKKGDIH
jgi:hypothetical protein